MKTKNKNTKILLGLGLVLIVLAILGSAYYFFGPQTTQGEKSITIEVVDANKISTIYTLNTDAQYLLEAMDDAKSEGFTYEGEDGEYGFTIYSIQGITADFNVDSSYWSIMVNGSYGQYGASSQPVTDGDEFRFVYETYTP